METKHVCQRECSRIEYNGIEWNRIEYTLLIGVVPTTEDTQDRNGVNVVFQQQQYHQQQHRLNLIDKMTMKVYRDDTSDLCGYCQHPNRFRRNIFIFFKDPFYLPALFFKKG